MFIIFSVFGARSSKSFIRVLKVTSYEPPTGSADELSSITPFPSRGNAVPEPSSVICVVILNAFLKNVLFAMYVVLAGKLSTSLRSGTGARLILLITIVYNISSPGLINPSPSLS